LIDDSPLKVKLKTKKLISQFAFVLVSLTLIFSKVLRYNGEENALISSLSAFQNTKITSKKCHDRPERHLN